MVALPCGSKSINKTLRFVAANEAAKLTAVVVLPTPPFWFAIAIIFPTSASIYILLLVQFLQDQYMAFTNQVRYDNFMTVY